MFGDKGIMFSIALLLGFAIQEGYRTVRRRRAILLVSDERMPILLCEPDLLK
jgi:hypothetical protein